MKVVLLLALLSASECDSTEVKGQTGQDVTLPCKYDRKYHGALSACWGRGQIPASGCSDQLISTDGSRVETRASSRYELLGRLEEGDVSLTILNLTEGDAGRYGCRVEIRGPFNDEKHEFDLTVTAPLIPTPAASPSEPPSEPTAAAQTEGHMTSSGSPSSSSGVMSSSEKQAYTSLMPPLICILLGLVFMLTLSGLFIASRRQKRPIRIPQQQMVGSSAQQVQVSSTSLNLQLQSSTVYNVYQMDSDGGEDGGVYEYCP